MTEVTPDPKPPKRVTSKKKRKVDGEVGHSRAKMSDPAIEVVDVEPEWRAAARATSNPGGERPQYKTAAEKRQERYHRVNARLRKRAAEKREKEAAE